MDLEQYRKNRGLTYDELARDLGLKIGTIFRACKKTGKTSLSTAHQIVQKTGGVISYADLLNNQPRG